MGEVLQNWMLKKMYSKLEKAITATRLVMLSIGVISTVILLKVAIIPYAFHLFISTLPLLASSLHFCLSPPFIYIILNFIIITIAASSTSFKPSSSSSSSNIDSHHDVGIIIATSNDSKHHPQEQQDPSILAHLDSTTNIFNPPSNEPPWHDFVLQDHQDQDEEVKQVVWNSSSAEKSTDPSLESFTHGEKDDDDQVKEVDQLEDTITMEATWKSIMEGQGREVVRHLRKSETWDVIRTPRLERTGNADKIVVDNEEEEEGIGVGEDPVDWARKELRKSETFNDRVSFRREKSMSQEELKQRADAFIKKFNNDMRLQRQESEQRFLRILHNPPPAL